MRPRSFDNYILIFMLCLGITGLFLFYSPINLEKQLFPIQQQAELGEVVSVKNAVKIKESNRVLWSDISNQQKICINDEIYTHAQSEISLKLKNNSIVNLSENTLIKLTDEKANIHIHLKKGIIKILTKKLAKNFSITFNLKKYQILGNQNSELLIEKENNYEKISLLKGSVKIAKENEHYILKENQSLEVDPNIKKNLIVQSNPYLIKEPLDNDIFYYQNKIDINFSWKILDSSLKKNPDFFTYLVISKNRVFSNLSQKWNQKVNASASNAKLTFYEEGYYYWRLENSNNSIGTLHYFQIKKEPLLHISVSEDTLVYTSRNPELFLKWNHVENSQYELSITNPSGKNDLIKLSRNNFLFHLSEIGNYYFKVRVIGEKHPQSIFGPIQKVKLINKENSQNTKLEALTPTLIERIVYNKKPLQFPVYWSDSPQQKLYNLRLYQNNRLVQEAKTYARFFFFQILKEGEFKWEVTTSEQSTPSLKQKIEGILKIKYPSEVSHHPSEGAVILLDRPDQIVEFKWNHFLKSQQYTFELSEDNQFKNIIFSKKISLNQLTTSIQRIGKFYWRVKFFNKNALEFSGPQSVEFRPSPIIEPPRILPDVKIKTNIQTSNPLNLIFKNIFYFFINAAKAENTPQRISWKVPSHIKVKKYIVEIYSEKKATKLIQKIESNRPLIEWKNPKIGQFYWRLAYQDFWGRTSHFSNFTLLEILPSKNSINEKLDSKEIIPIKNLVNPLTSHSDTPTMTNQNSDLSFFTFPSYTQYERKIDQNKILINGVHLLNLGFNYFHPAIRNKHSQLEITISRGKVFENHIYQKAGLHFIQQLFELNLIQFNWKLSFIYRNQFKIESNRVTEKNKWEGRVGTQIIFPSILVFSQIKSQIEAGTNFYLSIELQREIGKTYSISPFYSAELSTNEKESRIGLKLNGHFFL